MIYIHAPRAYGGSICAALGIEDTHKTAQWHRLNNPDYKKEDTAAFIRNPWTHAVSWWFWTEWKRYNNFAVWVEMGMPSSFKFNRYKVPGQPMGWHNPVHQEHWLEWEDELLVEHIFKVENLVEDFGKLCALFGVKRRELPHRNKAKHADYRQDMWTPALLRMAEPVLRPFADKYGYDF